MRVLGFIFAVSIALAALKAALAVLVIAYLVFLSFAMLFRPRETLAWFGFLLACWLLQEHTVATLLTFCVVLLACAIAKRIEP